MYTSIFGQFPLNLQLPTPLDFPQGCRICPRKTCSETLSKTQICTWYLVPDLKIGVSSGFGGFDSGPDLPNPVPPSLISGFIGRISSSRPSNQWWCRPWGPYYRSNGVQVMKLLGKLGECKENTETLLSSFKLICSSPEIFSCFLSCSG